MFVLGWASVVSAQTSTCPQVTRDHTLPGIPVQIETPLSPRWGHALDAACTVLASHSDIDRSAQVSIAPVPESNVLQLVVVLADGRKTQRTVYAPHELAFTLEALLLLPVWAGAKSVDPTVALTAPESADELDPMVTDTSADTESERPPPIQAKPALAHRPAGLGHEISVNAGARVGRAPAYVSSAFELNAGLLRDEQWLGLTLRWEPSALVQHENVPSGFKMHSLALGLMAARRMTSGFADIELGLTVMGSKTTQRYEQQGDWERERFWDVHTGIILRALLGKASMRWVLAANVDCAPQRIWQGGRRGTNFPLIPIWSVGFGVGVAWEKR